MVRRPARRIHAWYGDELWLSGFRHWRLSDVLQASAGGSSASFSLFWFSALFTRYILELVSSTFGLSAFFWLDGGEETEESVNSFLGVWEGVVVCLYRAQL